jgi:putative peptidoglycan lipid II flippase
MQRFNWNLVKEKSDLISHRNIMVVALLYILNSVTALLKDVFFASYFGTSQYADTLLMSFFLPDTVGTSLLAAAVGASCVPVFSRIYSYGGQQRLRRCIKKVSIIIFLILLAVAAVLYVFRHIVSNIMGYGPENEAIDLFQQLLLVFLPYMMLIPFITIGASALQAQGRFAIASLPQTVFNLVFLTSILFSAILKIPASNGVYAVAYCIVGGSVAMAALVWIPLAKRLFKYGSTTELSDNQNACSNDCSVLAEISKVFLPYILILLSTQSILYVERLLASGLDPGSVTGLNYAFRLSQVPVWIFAAAISVVALPALSRVVEPGREEEFRAAFQKHLKLVFLITVPTSLILFILRVPTITVLLKHGAFDSASLQKTSTVLSGFSLSVIGQCVIYISLRAFMAMGKMLVPMAISFATAAINIIADILLVKKIGLAGIGYGAIIGSSLNAILIIYALYKILNFDLRKLTKQMAMILLLNIPLAVIAVVADILWDIMISRSCWGVQFLYLGISILTSITIYYINIYNCKFLKDFI